MVSKTDEFGICNRICHFDGIWDGNHSNIAELVQLKEYCDQTPSDDLVPLMEEYVYAGRGHPG